jgi:hypothetical protein
MMVCLVGNVETAAILLRRMLLRILARHVRKSVNFWIILVIRRTAGLKGWTQESGKKSVKKHNPKE